MCVGGVLYNLQRVERRTQAVGPQGAEVQLGHILCASGCAEKHSHTSAHHPVVKPPGVLYTAASHTGLGRLLGTILESIGGDVGRMHPDSRATPMQFGLHKIFVYVEAVVHESTILSPPPPTCIAHPGAILLHDHWTVYNPPSDPPFVCYIPYNIGYTNIV